MCRLDHLIGVDDRRRPVLCFLSVVVWTASRNETEATWVADSGLITFTRVLLEIQQWIACIPTVKRRNEQLGNVLCVPREEVAASSSLKKDNDTIPQLFCALKTTAMTAGASRAIQWLQ